MPASVSLADRFALAQTELAAERTLLAYVRTALTLAAAGVGIVKLAVEPALAALGWSFVAFAVLVAGIGVARYRLSRRVVEAIAREAGLSPARAPTPPG
jgi:putative membrane protein